MLDIFKTYATDLRAETDGVWRDMGSASFLIARADNSNYVKAIAETWEKHREQVEAGGEEAEELSARLLAEVTADTILLDWKNVSFKGKKYPYNRENAIALFMEPSLKDFQNKIMTMARDVEYYKLKEEEEQVKN